jgi:hypothetical protein
VEYRWFIRIYIYIRSYIDKLQSQFKNLDLNRITSENHNDQEIMPKNNYKGKYATHTSITRNWYPKPTPLNIQFEERELGLRAAYTADALYEWNIDGLSEYIYIYIYIKDLT